MGPGVIANSKGVWGGKGVGGPWLGDNIEGGAYGVGGPKGVGGGSGVGGASGVAGIIETGSCSCNSGWGVSSGWCSGVLP